MGDSLQPPSALDILRMLIERLKAPLLLFPIAIIVAVAIWGGAIPPAFRILIYVVVILALVAYITGELLKVRRAAPPSLPPPPGEKVVPPPGKKLFPPRRRLA